MNRSPHTHQDHPCGAPVSDPASPCPRSTKQRVLGFRTFNVQRSTFNVPPPSYGTHSFPPLTHTLATTPVLAVLILLSLILLHAPTTRAADLATNTPTASPSPALTPAAPLSNTPARPTPPSVTPPPRASTNTLTLESFRIIGDRNIFNPNRSSRTARGTNEIRRTPKIDSIAFVGTMAFTKGTFAFFNSSSSDYRKRLTRGELIAGFEIKEIHPSLIKLEHDGQIMQLKLGQQLRREDDGPWQVSDRSDPTTTPNSSASTSDSPSEAPPPGASDLLRRLMEKRQQEMKQ